MKAKRKRIEFKFVSPEAKQVMLSGTFNNWSETSDPMKKDDKGVWRKVKILPPGRYEYKMIVDDKWVVDPECNETDLNKHGTLNSVVRF